MHWCLVPSGDNAKIVTKERRKRLKAFFVQFQQTVGSVQLVRGIPSFERRRKSGRKSERERDCEQKQGLSSKAHITIPVWLVKYKPVKD